MRIAIPVALAYMLLGPLIINLVDDRPRFAPFRSYRIDGERVKRPKHYHCRNTFPSPVYNSLGYDLPERIRHDETPFFLPQAICVFLITLGVRTHYRLEVASKHLAALQSIKDRTESDAVLSGPQRGSSVT